MIKYVTWLLALAGIFFCIRAGMENAPIRHLLLIEGTIFLIASFLNYKKPKYTIRFTLGVFALVVTHAIYQNIIIEAYFKLLIQIGFILFAISYYRQYRKENFF